MAAQYSSRRNQTFLSGTTVGHMLNPPKATYLRDYKLANRIQRKALEASAVSRRLAAEEAASQPFKLPTQGKYEHVESRVSKFLTSPAKSAPGDENAGDVGASSGNAGGSPFKRTLFSKKATTEPPSPPKPFVRPVLGERKAALPKFSEMPVSPSQSTSPSRNFVVHNIATLVPAPRIITVDPSVPEPKREGYGKVPTYLESRKAEWAAKSEKERKEKEIRDACPPGHRMMPEEERVETLAMVTSALEIAKKELNAMPLRVEIPSALRKKADLEAKVSKLEDALTKFSRSKVFVRMDK